MSHLDASVFNGLSCASQSQTSQDGEEISCSSLQFEQKEKVNADETL